MARFDVLTDQSAAMGGMLAGGEVFHRLGLMYATGRAVPVDRIAAHMWFNIAAMNGDRDAARHRREIAEEMSADEVAAAQRAARQWLSRN